MSKIKANRYENTATTDGGIDIDTSGRVGIGTASPDGTLHVHSNSAGSITANSGADDLVIENNGDTGISILTADGNNATAIFFGCPTQTVGAAIRYNNSTHEMSLGPDDPSGGYLRINSGDGVEAARIDSSGRLLVGSTSAYVSDANFQVTDDTNAKLVISNPGNASYSLAVGTDNALAFKDESNAVERMRIDIAGRLMLGTTTEGAANEADNLTIADSGDVGITLRSTNSGFNRIYFSDGTSGASEYAGYLLYKHADNAMIFGTNATERMRLRSDGRMLVPGVYAETTGGSANVNVQSDGLMQRSVSSIKYKKDVETLQDSYADALLNVRPVWYKSKCTSDNPDWGHWGFIAEELAEIDPRLVIWKTAELSYDEQGVPVKTACEPEAEGVQYDRFVPHLLNLIKRQQTAIETLETKVAALEAG